MRLAPSQARGDQADGTRPQLTTIDLFAGAGGITEGFRQAGFSCLYANDADATAIETFKHNHPSCPAESIEIQSVDARAVRRSMRLSPGELGVLVGGPPCQGFSINAPERFLADPRNRLFREYVRFLEEFKPRCFFFENVPGLLSLADGAVLRQILREFWRLGYETVHRVLFAPHYGVPQERWRMVILGSTQGEVEMPEPTHHAVGRANFRGGATLTIRLGADEIRQLPRTPTVAAAIGDLPVLGVGEGAEVVGYTESATSDYARRLRNPAGITYNHYSARLSRQNMERMKFVPPGGSWRDIPRALLPRGMQRARRSDHTKRYGRLSEDGLAGTIMTKCDPHWGAVFLPSQDRALTVREAARFQSFPDSYRFAGSRVSQYVQVGNAVPVLLARAIADRIAEHLGAGSSGRTEAEASNG